MIISADPPPRFTPPPTPLRPGPTRTPTQLSAYAAARIDPNRHNWTRSTPRSADADILLDRESLVSRSRDAVRNDPLAVRAIGSKVANVISTGPTPQSVLDAKTLGLTVDQARELRNEQEAAFRLWAEECDASGRLAFGAFCALTYRGQEQNGESLTQFATLPQPSRVSPLALYAIEPDRLASPGGLYADPRIRDGVELGDWDRPVAYHIREAAAGDWIQHPRRSAQKFTRIPATDHAGRPLILHLYHVDRASQSRGVPCLSPVLTRLRDLSDYLEAEIQGAVAASSMVWAKTTELPEDADEYGADGLPSVDERGTYLEDIEPLSIYNLAPGEKLDLLSSDRPGSAFGVFVSEIKRTIAAGLHLPYELLTADFSQSNYSNLRGALLEARRYFEMDQADFISGFCLPVWRRVLEDLYLRGLWGRSISPERFYSNRRAWLAVRFLPRGWEWVDPRNDATAAEVALRNRMTTHRRIFAARGEDAEEQISIMAEERDLFAAHDLPFPLPQPMPTPAAATDPEETQP